MAIRKIVKVGDPVLRKTSRPVEEITPRITRLVEDMIDTMRDANGCGLAAVLAAVQVGVLRRVVVIEVEEGNPIVLINPRIVAFAGEQCEQEGCLSLPGKWGTTRRPKHVTVRALDLDGKEVEYTGSDLLARAFCHELDHLDGKLFTDALVGELEG